VWLALVKRYIAISPRQLWPEKPLDRHTSRDLELLVLRWKSVKAGWAANRSTTPIPRQRLFSISEQSAPYVSPCLYLVEGGRWLLVGTRFGAVQYYDLNAVNISAITLIPSLFDGLAEIWLSADMDSVAESLVFHLGVLTRRRPNTNDPAYPHSPRYARWIQVWQITTEVGSNGCVRGLTSELKSSFCEEYEPTCFSFRLRGRYVAYSLFYSDLQVGPLNHGHRVIIVDWTTSNSTSLNYTRKSISTKASVSDPSYLFVVDRNEIQWLVLLPDDRLLCYTDINFVLYDLANAPTTTPPSQHHQYYSSTASLLVHARSISQPYFLPNSTRLTFLTMDGVKGMTISNSRDSKLDLVNLLTAGNFPGDFICMGYNFSAMIHSWPTITFLQYAWPEETLCSTFFQNTVIQQETFPDNPTLLTDLSSGRVVVCGNSQNKQYMLEPCNVL
jgi:hypothetical protein